MSLTSEYEYELGELEGESEVAGEVGELGEFEGELGELGELEGELGEFGEFEGELELSPLRRVYPDAMMEHMAHLAAESESEQEAVEAFLPLIPMIAAKVLPLAAKALPLAAKALPKVVSAVSKATPHLTRGVSQVTRALYRSPLTRQLVRTVPRIAQGTATSLIRQVSQGRPITRQTVIRTLARQAGGLLRNRPLTARLIRRSRAMDRGYHRAAGRGPSVGCARCQGQGPVCPRYGRQVR